MANIIHADEPNNKLIITRASREMDLTSQALKQTASLTIMNEGDTPTSYFLYSVDNGLASNLAFIQASVSCEFLVL